MQPKRSCCQSFFVSPSYPLAIEDKNAGANLMLVNVRAREDFNPAYLFHRPIVRCN